MSATFSICASISKREFKSFVLLGRKRGLVFVHRVLKW